MAKPLNRSQALGRRDSHFGTLDQLAHSDKYWQAAVLFGHIKEITQMMHVPLTNEEQKRLDTAMAKVCEPGEAKDVPVYENLPGAPEAPTGTQLHGIPQPVLQNIAAPVVQPQLVTPDTPQPASAIADPTPPGEATPPEQ